MDMVVGVTEEAVSIIRYSLPVPVWSSANLFAYRTPQNSQLRILIPNNTTLVILRCQPNLEKDVENQLQPENQVNIARKFTKLSTVKGYPGNEVRPQLQWLTKNEV